VLLADPGGANSNNTSSSLSRNSSISLMINAVINFRGEVVFRTPRRIEAERWIRAATARFFSGAL
jgi:hypothetical protein